MTKQKQKLFIGTLKYWDLGRGKAKGELVIEADTPEEFNEKMYKEFSKHLMSSNIGFDNGKIFAGFHKVGEYSLVGVEL